MEGVHMSQNKISKRGYSTLQLILASFAFGSIMVFWTIYNSYVPLILDEKLGDLGSITLSAATISTLIGFIMAIDNFFGLIFQPLFGKNPIICVVAMESVCHMLLLELYYVLSFLCLFRLWEELVG